jgi:hypothetical protein
MQGKMTKKLTPKGPYNLGRACSGANQQKLTTCTKSGGQEKKKFKKKRIDWPYPSVDPRPETSGHPPGMGRYLDSDILLNFFIF